MTHSKIIMLDSNTIELIIEKDNGTITMHFELSYNGYMEALEKIKLYK